MYKKKNDNFIEKIIKIKRVTKVVKGGRIMSFSVLSVVGDKKGNVGVGKGKSKEIPMAAKKASCDARKNMVTIPLNKNSLFHTVSGKHCASKVIMFPAGSGKGIIAGISMRTILEFVGIKNIVAKSIGSNNPYNIVRATLNGLLKIRTPSQIYDKKHKSIKTLRLGEVK